MGSILGKDPMASDILRLGDVAPSFSLSNVDGRIWSLADLAEKSVVVVIFSCNHCPYVQAYEDRMVAIQWCRSSQAARRWWSTPRPTSP